MRTIFNAAPDPSWLEVHAPSSLRGDLGGLELWQWLALLVGAMFAFGVGRTASYVVMKWAVRLAKRTKVTWDETLLAALRPPSRFFFALLTFDALLDLLALPATVAPTVERLMGIILIGAVAWTAMRIVDVIAAYIELRARETADKGIEGELQVRGVKTHVRVLRRVVDVCIGIVALALILTQFEVVRKVGMSLLASAGLAGVVLGFAAQRTFGSLIAGIQLSATQPIRIGDVVVIEKEWGTIEEITLTYVVVKVWDERRLIVPVSRFLEHSFENWTKSSAELHGSVMLYADWTLPVEALRKEVEHVMEENPHWDRRTKSVQVTGVKDHMIEVRVLVSAHDASKMWDLRVQLREHLVTWLQNYESGRFLPRFRLENGLPTP